MIIQACQFGSEYGPNAARVLVWVAAADLHIGAQQDLMPVGDVDLLSIAGLRSIYDGHFVGGKLDVPACVSGDKHMLDDHVIGRKEEVAGGVKFHDSPCAGLTAPGFRKN